MQSVSNCRDLQWTLLCCIHVPPSTFHRQHSISYKKQQDFLRPTFRGRVRDSDPGHLTASMKSRRYLYEPYICIEPRVQGYSRCWLRCSDSRQIMLPSCFLQQAGTTSPHWARRPNLADIPHAPPFSSAPNDVSMRMRRTLLLQSRAWLNCALGLTSRTTRKAAAPAARWCSFVPAAWRAQAIAARATAGMPSLPVTEGCHVSCCAMHVTTQTAACAGSAASRLAIEQSTRAILLPTCSTST